jgi:hypothetical protein
VIAKLLTAVIFPEFVPLPGGDKMRLVDIARCVAEDDHPGDDAVGPCSLLTSAIEIVDLPALRRLVVEGGGSLAINGEIARDCCKTYDEDLKCLAWHALQDAGNEPSLAGCSPNTAALILVCGVLMHEVKGHA